MHHRLIIGCLVWLPVLSPSGIVATAADSRPIEQNKGLTVGDLARGLQSAAQNIEKEIPKIGPAIGKTIKSVTGSSSEKTKPQHPPSDKQ